MPLSSSRGARGVEWQEMIPVPAETGADLSEENQGRGSCHLPFPSPVRYSQAAGKGSYIFPRQWSPQSEEDTYGTAAPNPPVK